MNPGPHKGLLPLLISRVTDVDHQTLRRFASWRGLCKVSVGILSRTRLKVLLWGSSMVSLLETVSQHRKETPDYHFRFKTLEAQDSNGDCRKQYLTVRVWPALDCLAWWLRQSQLNLQNKKYGEKLKDKPDPQCTGEGDLDGRRDSNDQTNWQLLASKNHQAVEVSWQRLYI